MAAKFEVYVDKSGEYRWRLRATNGQIVATGGESYKTKDSCMGGINSVKKNVDAEVVELEAEKK